MEFRQLLCYKPVQDDPHDNARIRYFYSKNALDIRELLSKR